MPADASEATHCHLEIASLNTYRFAVEQGISYLVPGRIQYARESAPGYAHSLSAILLIQPFKIIEADRLGFFHQKPDFLEISRSYVNGPELGYRRD